MAWEASATVSAALTLSGAWQTVQASGGGDLEVGLDPQETLHVQAELDPQATPTENCHLAVQASADGTSWDTPEHALHAEVLVNDEDPARRSFIVRGPWRVRFQAMLIETDGTPGGDDTGSTLTLRYRKDGVAA